MERKKIALLMGMIILVVLAFGLWYLSDLPAWRLSGYVIDYDGTPMKGVTVTLKEIEGEFVEEFTVERRQKKFSVETDDNGYYEFRATIVANKIPSGKWTMDAATDIAGREYVSWEDDVFIYARDQERNISFLDKDTREAHRSFSNAIIKKFEGIGEESAPGASTGIVGPRLDISELGKYYIQIEEVFNGTNYSIVFTLGADDKIVKEVEPVYLYNSRVYVIEDEPWRYKDTIPPFKGVEFKNCLGLDEIAKSVAPGVWRITNESGMLYTCSPTLDDWCKERDCGDVIFLTENSFNEYFTTLYVTKTDDANMDYITYEVKEVTEWLKMR